MAKYPLALLPVVTISAGEAQLAPPGYGVSTEVGTPAQAIASWVAQGASWIHVLDQDAADGSGHNLDHVVTRGAHLQYAGAVGDDARLAAALETGAARVIIDPADHAWASEIVAKHGDRVAVGLDIRAEDAVATALALQHAGCRRFVVTDQATTHHWRHHDRHLLAEFCEEVHRPVMALGGIAHLGDLHQLHQLVPNGLDGIIVDGALYNGSFTYAEAMAAGADTFDMFYWGPPS